MFTELKDSWFRRLDPRVKLAWLFGLSIVSMGMHTLAGVLVLICIGMLPAWYLARHVKEMMKITFSWKMGFFLVMVGLIWAVPLALHTLETGTVPSLSAAEIGVRNLLRFYLMITSAIFVLLTMDHVELAEAIRRLKKAFAPDGWNTYVETFAFMMGTGFHLVPVFLTELDDLVTIQRGRGIGVREGGKIQRVRNYMRLVRPLVNRTMEVARNILIAMHTAGYSTMTTRSQMRVLKFRLADWATLCTIVGCAIALTLISM